MLSDTQGKHLQGLALGSLESPPYAASVATSTGSTIAASSFSGLLTRVEIGHIRIGAAGNGRIRSRGSARADCSSSAQAADHDGRRFVTGDQFGRTSAPISPQAVQTILGHKERTGIPSGSPSAFMTAL
jgi:hypothetical protein